MKRTASRPCNVLRKWLPTAACSTSFTRFCMVPTIEMTFGALVSGTWICTCRSIRNTKPSRLLRLDRRQVRVEVVRLADTASAQFSVRIDVGTISAAYTRGLIGYLPVRSGSCQMPRWPGRTIEPNLNSAPRRVERRQTDVRLDDRHLTLVDDEHRHHLDPDQERVQQVGAVEQRVVLQTDLAAVRQERLEVLVVVVQVVLGAEQDLDDLGIAGLRSALHRPDVVEPAEAAGDVPGTERLTFERGDDADHVLSALRGDHARPAAARASSPNDSGVRRRPSPARADEVRSDGQAVHLARR